MDLVDYDCQLLYKQSLETWFEDKDRTKKFSDEDLKSVQILQQKYKFKYDENEEYDYKDRTYLNGRFGHLYYSEPDPVLFSFTEVDGTVTLYKRSLEEDKKQNGSEKEGPSGKKIAESSESSTRSAVLQRIVVDNLIMGSKYRGKMLAYSCKGHILLIDLDTKIGTLVAIWPLDPKILASGGGYCLMPYDPDINAAVSGDLSLVAATGPPDKEGEDDEEEGEIQIRIFNLNTKECSLKTMKLGGGLVYRDINNISFNPCHPDLLYVTVYIENKSKFHLRKKASDCEESNVHDNDNGDDNDNDYDDDDDDDDDVLLILYDLSTGQVLAEMFSVSSMPICNTFFHNSTVDVTFLKQGTMLLAYKPPGPSSSSIHLAFLDAFSLEMIGIVNMAGLDAVLGSHLLISKCQCQFAIFNCQNLESSGELKYDVKVYEVPENDFSLKNFCRKVILDKVDMNHVDNLSLPNVLKNYLKL